MAINLKVNPFYLNDEDIKWVEETRDNMTTEEKIGQLFCLTDLTDDKSVLKNIDDKSVLLDDKSILKFTLDKVKPGAIMYRPGIGKEMQEMHRFLQENSNIPMLISANLESGGNGIATDSTYFGKQLQVAATDDENIAYKLGVVCGREGSAAGCNWGFSPVIDIDMNFRNPITNVRTYGSSPERVLRMAKSYMKGMHENNVAVAIKHFPGDGVDERDQHLLTSVNSLSVEEWDKTFGYVYKEMIEKGAHTVMVGHISQPAYSKKLNPQLKGEEIMPATLAPEILNDLLREKLGFNGMIITDASDMAGFTVAMKRQVAVPQSIQSGCDMFLFTKNLAEDYSFMLNGLKNGILTEERLNEAVTRILAVKASLGLHNQQKENKLVLGEDALSILKCEEHEAWAKECADKSVTLVKDTQKLLPINNKDYKRILLHVLGHDEGVEDEFKALLEKEGFEVEVFNKENVDSSILFISVDELKSRYDLVMYLANIKTASNQTTVRTNWAHPRAVNLPWLVQEIPTLFISVASPYHLQDVPMVKTFINAYSANQYSLEAIIEKILGKSEFKGINPVNPFCNCPEAKY